MAINLWIILFTYIRDIITRERAFDASSAQTQIIIRLKESYFKIPSVKLVFMAIKLNVRKKTFTSGIYISVKRSK
jgi:hypothetical protein